MKIKIQSVGMGIAEVDAWRNEYLSWNDFYYMQYICKTVTILRGIVTPFCSIYRYFCTKEEIYESK